MSKPTHLKASELVSAARAQSGLSQQDFGRKVGKSQGLISKYESGHVAPPASVMIHCMNTLSHSGVERSEPPGGWAAVQAAMSQLQKALAAVAPPHD